MNELQPLPLACRAVSIPYERVVNWMRFGLHGQKLKAKMKGARFWIRPADIVKFCMRHQPRGIKVSA